MCELKLVGGITGAVWFCLSFRVLCVGIFGCGSLKLKTFWPESIVQKDHHSGKASSGGEEDKKTRKIINNSSVN